MGCVTSQFSLRLQPMTSFSDAFLVFWNLTEIGKKFLTNTELSPEEEEEEAEYTYCYSLFLGEDSWIEIREGGNVRKCALLEETGGKVDSRR